MYYQSGPFSQNSESTHGTTVLDSYSDVTYSTAEVQLLASFFFKNSFYSHKNVLAIISSMLIYEYIYPYKFRKITFNASKDKNPKCERKRRAVWNSWAGGGGLHSVTGSGKLLFCNASSLCCSRCIS